jgi:hypothetical protein
MGYFYYLYQKKTPTLENILPDFKMTADELYDEFEGEETEADRKYNGKVLSVSGKVVRIDKVEEYTTVSLGAKNALAYGVNCSFNSNITNLSVGDSLVLKGQYIGFLTDVLLNNCTIEWSK